MMDRPNEHLLGEPARRATGLRDRPEINTGPSCPPRQTVASADHSTPAGGDFAAFCCVEHGSRIQIAVIDSGQGSSAELQRAELRSVEETIALLGGRMEIDSRRGEGTTVLLRLPQPHRSRSTTRINEAVPVTDAVTVPL